MISSVDRNNLNKKTMDKEAVNNLIINELKSKGIFIGSIAPEVLEAFSKMMYKAINYTHSCESDSKLLIGLLTKLENGGGNNFIDKKQIVDDYLEDN